MSMWIFKLGDLVQVTQVNENSSTPKSWELLEVAYSYCVRLLLVNSL